MECVNKDVTLTAPLSTINPGLVFHQGLASQGNVGWAYLRVDAEITFSILFENFRKRNLSHYREYCHKIDMKTFKQNFINSPIKLEWSLQKNLNFVSH